MSDSGSGFVAVNGGSLYYEEQGSGPAVCLIHAGVANLRMWDGLVPLLVDRWRVVRYDTRGFGRSESQPVDFSDHDDLVAVLDHTGAEEAILVGVSRAGSIALDFTLEYPERVRGLVLVSSAPRGLELPPSGQDESMWDEEEARLAAKDWEWLAQTETAWWVDGPGQEATRVDPAVRSLVHGWILDNYRAEKETGNPMRLDPPAGTRLTELGIPLLVIVGDLDDRDTIAASEMVADAVAGARLEVFEGAAHMLSLEQPQRFADVLLGFLEGLD
jgi:3-oxoadipate enol-lactonase